MSPSVAILRDTGYIYRVQSLGDVLRSYNIIIYKVYRQEENIVILDTFTIPSRLVRFESIWKAIAEEMFVFCDVDLEKQRAS